MSKYEVCKRQFVQTSKAWYAKANLPEGDTVDVVTIAWNYDDGGTAGEFEVSWAEKNGSLVPKLSVFSDGWKALYQFKDLLEYMASIDGKGIKPDEFCRKLVELGIEDTTPTKSVRD